MNENSQDKQEKKVIGFAIKIRIIGKMQEEGYQDINDYIDALKQQITKLQKAREQMQNDLQQANLEKDNLQAKVEQLEAKLKECENADKNEV